MLRDHNYGRPFNRGLSRQLLFAWVEPDLLILIGVFAAAIVCPTSFAPKYDIAAIIWIAIALPIAQLLARIDPRLLRKWRAHRHWRGPGSAILPFVVDERPPLRRWIDRSRAAWEIVRHLQVYTPWTSRA